MTGWFWWRQANRTSDNDVELGSTGAKRSRAGVQRECYSSAVAWLGTRNSTSEHPTIIFDYLFFRKERLAMINVIFSFSSDVDRENKPFQTTSLLLALLKTESNIWQSGNNKANASNTVSGHLYTENKTSRDALEPSNVKVWDNELVALSKLMNDDICIKTRWIKMPCHWSPRAYACSLFTSLTRISPSNYRRRDWSLSRAVSTRRLLTQFICI